MAQQTADHPNVPPSAAHWCCAATLKLGSKASGDAAGKEAGTGFGGLLGTITRSLSRQGSRPGPKDGKTVSDIGLAVANHHSNWSQAWSGRHAQGMKWEQSTGGQDRALVPASLVVVSSVSIFCQQPYEPEGTTAAASSSSQQTGV